MRDARALLGDRWVDGEETIDVVDKYTRKTIGRVPQATREQVAEAAAAAFDAFGRDPIPPYQRFEILSEASRLVEARREELVDTIVAESGFTVADAAGEVTRCVQTLLLSAEEAKRIQGEMVPLDAAPGGPKRLGFTLRFPLGVVCAITPFNSPLNTVAHKLGPALAAGNTVVLKPSSYTPLTAALLCEILETAGTRPGHVNLVFGGGGDAGSWLLEQPKFAFFAFTGSTEVGRKVRAAAGLRKSQLELGSISATIVCQDADLSRAVPLIINAAFRKAGQVCTSVQRLYVHDLILPVLLDQVVEEISRRSVGDPRDERTFVGPMIDPAEAERAASWIDEAVAGGADVAAGGNRDGAMLPPTVLTGVSPSMRVMCDEIFAPVISVAPFHSLKTVIDDINATPYGLATGIFTSDLDRAMWAAANLRVGSVHINETSSSRLDLMPYGGVKDSGTGREGPRYAVEEMTEERLVTLTLHDPPE